MPKRPHVVDRLGDVVPMHRAIWHQRLSLSRVVAGSVLAVVLSGLLLWSRPWVAQAWADVLLWWMQALPIPGHFDPPGQRLEGWLMLPVLFVDVQLPAPDSGAVFWHGAAVVLMWWSAAWLPDAAKPLAFLIRLVALIHGISVLFFLFWSASFTHSLSEHVASGLGQMWYLALLVPWIHLATYYLFPFALWQCAWLSVLTMAYMLVLAPLLYAFHIAVVWHLGLVVLPVLNLLFGVMLAVIGFVSLYGWGMSWQHSRGLDHE